MTQLEKKFSDYQESECEQDAVESAVIDTKICPTCTPNPNFVLPSPWWELDYAYLNEEFCEYHVSISVGEKSKYGNVTTLSSGLWKQEYAIKKILQAFDKPINDKIINDLNKALYERESNYYNGQKKFLYAIPAFNFDQVESKSSENSEQSKYEEQSVQNIVIEMEGFLEKLFQLQGALNLFSLYYSSIQNTSDSFVIRRSSDITQRINYTATIKNLKTFRKSLNIALANNGYPLLGFTGAFRSERVKRFKFVFKDDVDPFTIKSIWVLTDSGCEEYVQLKNLRNTPSTLPLTEKGMAQIYSFLNNLDEVINDLTAQETMPWIEWTLKHFYPNYVVDYGDITELDQSRAGLSCLLEEQFGLGEGQVVDYLSKQMTSAFTFFEKEANRSACRSVDDQISGGTVYQFDQQGSNDAELLQQAKEREIEKLTKKYKNQIEKVLFDYLKGQKDDLNKKDIYKKMFYIPTGQITITNFKGDLKGKQVTIPIIENPVLANVKNKISEDDVLLVARGLASQFVNESGKFDIEGDYLDSNISPYKILAKEARREKLDNFKNEFKDGWEDFKSGGRKSGNMDILDIFSFFGLCGITKTAEKAARCILNGVSYDDFLDMLIEKTIGFMEVNTLSLFLNALPYNFRLELDEAIEKEFGANVDLTSIFGVLEYRDPKQRVKKLRNSKKKAKRCVEIFKKIQQNKATLDDREELKNYLGEEILDKQSEAYETMYSHANFLNNPDNPNRVWKLDDKGRFEDRYPKPPSLYKDEDSENNYYKKNSITPERVAIAWAKHYVKEHEKSTKKWQLATDRWSKAFSSGTTQEENYDAAMNEYELAAKKFEETSLGVKVDVIYDIVLDFAIDYILNDLSADYLYELIQKYPAANFAFDAVTKLLSSPCPTAPLFTPPPQDFMKSLNVDVCNPTFQLQIPKLNIPSLSWRLGVKRAFGKVFKEALTRLIQDIMTNILDRVLSALESSLCNLAETAVSDLAGLGDGFIDALNEAFCNDGDDPETGRSKAEQLADALFSPISFDPSGNYEGSGRKAANVIAGVSSKNEILEAMVAEPGEENPQFNKRVSSAVKALAPEMESLLGSPNQVAYFFSNLGSYLSDDERERIRDLLDAGIPNLPISDAICLTNEQLEDWNALRENLLSAYPNPKDIVRNLNKKTLEELDKLMDIVGDLQTDGPFVGAIQDEILKDVCNKNNILNDVSQDSFSKSEEDELMDAFFGNIKNSLIRGFSGKNGVIGNALRDKENRVEFSRTFFRFFNPNYQNSQSEREGLYDSKSITGRFIMDALTKDGSVVGEYPETVAIYQRNQAIDESNKVYNHTNGASIIKYHQEFQTLLRTHTYEQNIVSFNSEYPKSFDYRVVVREKTKENSPFVRDMSYRSPNSISNLEEEVLESFGFQYKSNEEKNLRREAFKKILKSYDFLPGSFGQLYDSSIEEFSNNLIESLLTSGSEGGLPLGYTFGYVEDDITPDSYNYLNPEGGDYNKDESEKILGKFENPRIIPLDPAKYGGRYSSPPYFVEPRRFTGWVEIAVKAFETMEGCEPKNPALISFGDIANRSKMLSSSLKNSPKLTQDPDCIVATPYDLLVDSKIKSKLDAVVRTTLRTYVAEYFLKGYGLFSNIDITDENFNNSLTIYMVEKIKSEMMELGPDALSRNIRIAKERYWYTFLEQCVEVYQTMIDIDGIEPPDDVLSAIHEISLGQDAYKPITRRVKSKMKNYLSERKRVFQPNSVDERLDIISNATRMGLHSAAFRLSDMENRENWFSGKEFKSLQEGDIRLASIKKLQFFQKMYFIRLYEKESILIMSELLKDEIRRFSKLLVDGLYDKPYYRDMFKAFFGMKTFFPQSTSKVGLNSYYVDKQTNGSTSPGSIPSVKHDISTAQVAATDKPQLIVESYARVSPRINENTPSFLRNLSSQFIGAIPLKSLNNFLSQNASFFEDKYISDYFGDLSFTFEGSLRDLFAKGFSDNQSVNKLIQLNEGKYEPSEIKNLQNRFISMQDFEDIVVTYDESFIVDGEEPQPSGATGKTGITYGLRVSIVFPENYYDQEQIAYLQSNVEVKNLSRLEKSFVFDDGTIVVPLVSQEVDVVDSKFNEIERYDLECLINKMVKNPQFTLIFDKIFNFKQTSSCLALYCMETFLPSLGQDESERNEVEDEEPWEGTINEFGKNVLRREFKSLYLSRTRDGISIDLDDVGFGDLIGLGDPFGSLRLPSIRVPWWIKRRLKKKVFDKNGVECADPKKDLE